MAKSWQLQEAKNRFSEVVERANRLGPQEVTRHGKRVAVVISAREFDDLRSPRPPLWEYLRSASRFHGEDLVIERDRSPARDVDL